MRRLASALALAVLAIGCGGAPVQPAPTSRAQAPTSTVTVTTSDGVTVFGEVYDGGLPRSAPLVLLFHQAGSSGRGEYGPLIGWLNGLGLRAVAWDQRSGGDTHGVGNRTVEALPAGTPAAFCDAAPDLEAAFDWATEDGAERVVVWGSSYSAALAVRLAADRPVAGVVAASPASGGPMADCRARDRIGDVEAPVLVLRPASEMGLA
ncbi:alpha/beta hydrolase [Rubrivirga sp. IMCC43871]|uniref:alpha/beta hydrolase n=1 Tax=Rubrivirga sp. IMCC43871 TaxID=3391575 RepID=UPI0039901C09